MALAREVFAVAPQKAFLVTIGGAAFEHGSGFSEPVRAAIPEALKKICGLLAPCGES
jgi:Ni,Fe-hydrogenase maturation factor